MWTTIAPPATGSSRRYHGRLSHQRSHQVCSWPDPAKADQFSCAAGGKPMLPSSPKQTVRHPKRVFAG